MTHADDFDRAEDGTLLLRRRQPPLIPLDLVLRDFGRALDAGEQWKARERIRQLRASAGVKDEGTVVFRRPPRWGVEP